MGILYGRAGRLTTLFGGSRPGQWWAGGGRAFVRALAAALPPGTPGLAMWDAVNEPEHRASGLPFATKVG